MLLKNTKENKRNVTYNNQKLSFPIIVLIIVLLFTGNRNSTENPNKKVT